MITLNQVKKKLMGYFKTHPLITETYFMDVDDFPLNRNVTYGPVVNISKADSSQSGNLYTYNLLIMIADKISVDYPEIETEVQSDCEEIGRDFVTWLEEQKNFFYKGGARFTYFRDSTGDRISGITFTAAIPVHFTGRECDSPRISTNDDIPELNPPSYHYVSLPLALPPNSSDGELEIEN